jgi:prepilin signal peptidase PulO-like enzyme (type II secretory pathway)
MELSVILAVVIGLLAGGVINALADDLPLRRNPRLPRYVPEAKKAATHSPDEAVRAATQIDDEPRPPLAWLGLTAFLFGKRVSPGGVKLNWRYPITEIATAAAMAIAVLAVRDDKFNVIQIGFFLVYVAILILITVIDIEHRWILFVVIVPSAVICLIDALLTTLGDNSTWYQPGIVDALVGGALGFVVFFLFYNGGFLFTYIMGKLRGQEIKEIAFGYGDVMLATVSGLMLGWQALIFAMFITVFLGAFGALIYLLTRALLGARYSAFTALPYGPYIVLGTALMLLFREEVGRMFGGS